MIPSDPKQVKAICFDRIHVPGMNKLEVARQHGAYENLAAVLNDMEPEKIISEVKASGIRGRGGAGFPTGLKWSFVPRNTGKPTYLLCNADEGEPGTFKDRDIMRFDPHLLIEGMIVAGFALGVHDAYIYIRGEFVHEAEVLNEAINEAYAAGLLGERIAGSKYSMNLTVHRGAGAYICGEESALIESLEGKRGIPRIRPPFPVTHGYLGRPTVVNNVETFAAAAAIAVQGADWFAAQGSEHSKGGKLVSISGDCAAPGIYEYPFGTPLRHILYDCGAEDVQAVQVGGPAGALVGPAGFERRLAFEDLATGGSLMIYGRGCDLLAVIRNFARFFVHESCGFCTPCRVGTSLLKNGLDKIARGQGTHYDIDEIYRLATLVQRRSHCGLGHTAPNAILDVLEHFPEAIEGRLAHGGFEPYFDLDAALEEARLLSHREDAGAHLP